MGQMFKYSLFNPVILGQRNDIDLKMSLLQNYNIFIVYLLYFHTCIQFTVTTFLLFLSSHPPPNPVDLFTNYSASSPQVSLASHPSLLLPTTFLLFFWFNFIHISILSVLPGSMHMYSCCEFMISVMIKKNMKWN